MCYTLYMIGTVPGSKAHMKEGDKVNFIIPIREFGFKKVSRKIEMNSR